ncbi:hypothetical protein BV898_14081 [Hypsibius exemplaris]|uniref:Uncharacterized protein n=1 Tax=Hypsibius exemplaris TaxID=2072580 RepID=A0A1W0W8U9_HYPEX|nr:hypothetical protein BV898_14081 [Hypsibius exemplaris]
MLQKDCSSPAVFILAASFQSDGLQQNHTKQEDFSFSRKVHPFGNYLWMVVTTLNSLQIFLEKIIVTFQWTVLTIISTGQIGKRKLDVLDMMAQTIIRSFQKLEYMADWPWTSCPEICFGFKAGPFL